MRYTPRDNGTSFDGYEVIIKYLRENFLTQKELAKSLNIPESKMSEILHGHRRPTKKELLDIKDSLGIDMNEWRQSSKYINTVIPVMGNKF